MAERASFADKTPAAGGLNIPDPLSIPSLRDAVSDAEWRARVDLAACYRLVSLYGWDDLVHTHISARLPDEGGAPRFLLNPYGVFFDEMTASSLVKVDEKGAPVGDTPYFTNPAGFVIHSAVHGARDDAHCVLHLHTPFGVAVSAQAGGLKRLTQFAMIVGDDVAYHAYEGLATDLEERARLIADLGDKSFFILRNHGTLTLGENPAIAFARAHFLEQACRAQIYAQSDREPPIEESAEMAALVQRQAMAAFTPGLGDALIWPGLLRRLERANPGYDQ
ncbi:MAG: class II aldolase/adducin family protein [Parvularculaceae bacterium]